MATMPEVLKHSDPTNPAIKWQTYSTEYIDGLLASLKEQLDQNTADDNALKAELIAKIDSQDQYIIGKLQELDAAGRDIVQRIKDKGTEAYNEITQKADALRADISAAFNNHERILNEFKQELEEACKESCETLEARGTAAYERIIEKGNEAYDRLVEKGTEAYNRLGEIVNAQDGFIIGKLQEIDAKHEAAIKDLEDKQNEALKDLEDKQNEALKDLEDKHDSTLKDLEDKGKNAYDRLEAKGIELYDKLVEDLGKINSAALDLKAYVDEQDEAVTASLTTIIDEVRDLLHHYEQVRDAQDQYIMSKVIELHDKINAQGLPPGGIIGQILIKRTEDDFQCAWQSFEPISIEEIDAIIANL